MLLICLDCTAAYSVGAPQCPQCGSKKFCEQGSKKHEAMLAAAAAKASSPEEAPNVGG